METFQGDEDEEEEIEDRRYDELGRSNLEGAPSTQPTQVVGTRRRRSPRHYTLGTGALGNKGNGKTRRQ